MSTLGLLGRGLGRLRLPRLRGWTGGGLWAGQAGHVRPACSGGKERPPGSEPEVPPPGPARRALKEWTLRVSPFGVLRARLPCHLVVRPLDPLAYPDGDRVLVAVCSVRGGTRDLAGLQVNYNEALKEVAIVGDAMDPEAAVEVTAPVRFDLNIKSSGAGCVKVQNLECDHCQIETAQGTSILQSVKGQKLRVQTKGGHVICLGTVYGNTDIHASDKSAVTADKLQGSSMNVTTEDGSLEARYLYTESCLLSSVAGTISLGSVHGDITVQSKMGNITIDSSSGHLKASTHHGAIDVYVSQLGQVDLNSHQGSITVKVPSSLQAHFQLSGKEVDMDSEVRVEDMVETQTDTGVTVTGFMNEAREHDKRIHAHAPNGTVHFRTQSWFQSLKLPR